MGPIEADGERRRPLWARWGLVVLRCVGGATLVWLALQLTMGMWAGFYAAVAPEILRFIEPWPLTRSAELLADGNTLRFVHVYRERVALTPSVGLTSLSYGFVLWGGLVAAMPGMGWRARARDLLSGWVVVFVFSMVALVARVHHQYALITEAPFPELFDNWRGWTAYFLNLFFMELGFWVVPIGLALLMYGRRVEGWISGSEVG